MKFRLFVFAAGCLALAGLAWMARPALAQGDSPIIVRDGSIIIEPDQGSLGDWQLTAGNRVIRHPSGTRRLDAVEPSGTGAANDTCANRAHCRVVFTWSDGSRVVVQPVGNRQGLLVESSTPYTDPSWNRSGPSWTRTLPAGTTFTNVTIVDRDAQGAQPREICRGQGCAVRMFFR
jgi:hypothetical protein